MTPQRCFLRRGRRIHVVEIEAAFANRNDFGRLCEFTQFVDPGRIAVFRVMRMYADGSIDAGIALGDCDSKPVGFDRADSADRDQRSHAGSAGALDDRLSFGAQPGIGEMAMGIDQFRGHALADFSMRGKSATGALTLWPGLSPLP